ncbi:hypothetical protein ACLKA6_016117 [Drosophila palustris]
MTVTVTPYITRKGLIVRAPRPNSGYLPIEGSQQGLGVASTNNSSSSSRHERRRQAKKAESDGKGRQLKDKYTKKEKRTSNNSKSGVFQALKQYKTKDSRRPSRRGYDDDGDGDDDNADEEHCPGDMANTIS